MISKNIKDNHSDLFKDVTPDKINEFLRYFEEALDRSVQTFNYYPICDEFVDYSFEMFDSYAYQIFNNVNQHSFVANEIILSYELFLKLKQVIYAILRTKNEIPNYTGLIFTGFGEDEIYPQLIPVNISMVIDNRLRYYLDENSSASISNNDNAAVRPFAQTDVIDTILSGVDPHLDGLYLNNLDAVFKKYNQTILALIGNSNPLLSTQIQNLDMGPIVTEFNNMNAQIKREKYIGPLMSAVSNLSKEDLAEMAESLIYLTYLKRRITNAKESVGGPVDVAIISKGDGFIWIKRKHYFKPELNQHFFSNYFKK